LKRTTNKRDAANEMSLAPNWPAEKRAVLYD